MLALSSKVIETLRASRQASNSLRASNSNCSWYSSLQAAKIEGHWNFRYSRISFWCSATGFSHMLPVSYLELKNTPWIVKEVVRRKKNPEITDLFTHSVCTKQTIVVTHTSGPLQQICCSYCRFRTAVGLFFINHSWRNFRKKIKVLNSENVTI